MMMEGIDEDESNLGMMLCTSSRLSNSCKCVRLEKRASITIDQASCDMCTCISFLSIPCRYTKPPITSPQDKLNRNYTTKAQADRASNMQRLVCIPIPTEPMYKEFSIRAPEMHKRPSHPHYSSQEAT